MCLWSGVAVLLAIMIVPLLATAAFGVFVGFSGESTCFNTELGLPPQHCRTRIIAVNASGGVVEFHPQSNVDYYWDNTVDGRKSGSHAMERLLRVPEGTYNVLVQYSTKNAGTTLQLDDWAFAIESFAP